MKKGGGTETLYIGNEYQRFFRSEATHTENLTEIDTFGAYGRYICSLPTCTLSSVLYGIDFAQKAVHNVVLNEKL